VAQADEWDVRERIVSIPPGLRAVQDEAVSGEVFTEPLTAPSFNQSLNRRQHMSMQARAAAVNLTDGELMVISAAESFTRVYHRMNELSEVTPELTEAYIRFLNTYDHKIHEQLWKRIRY
jgi:hypothetical protein